jgi:DNA replication initiation complex subunit (GINS family)
MTGAMINNIEQEIANAKAKVSELEGFLKNQGKLARLPFDFGYADLKSFIKALKRASGAAPAKLGRPAKAAKVAKTPAAAKAKRGKRARITPEMKEAVKAAVVAGKTGATIAKELGISLPSVQNIKKEFGLVKARA